MRMHPKWIRGWLVPALLAHGFATAATPTPPLNSRTSPTLAEVDIVLEELMQYVWRLSQPEQDDARIRSAANDIARRVLTDATLKEIESLRAKLPETVDPGSGRIPPDAIAPLERILHREYCSISAVLSHWSDEVLWPVKTDMQGALARLPAVRRGQFEKELADIIAATGSDREQLEVDLKDCASLERSDLPMHVKRLDTAARGLQDLRRRLATAVAEGLDTGKVEKVRQLRTSSCPASRPPTPGNSRPQLAKQSTIQYPPLARNMGIEGSVRVRVEIDEGGCVIAATVLGTSASEMLDQAAVRRAFEMEWVPAEVDGKAARYAAILPVNFGLSEQ